MAMKVADWNFDAVPEEQLRVCSIWEYARESSTLRRAFDPKATAFIPNPNCPSQKIIDTESARLRDQVRLFALPVTLVIRHAKFGEDDPFDTPWTGLTSQTRNSVLKEMEPYYSDDPGPLCPPFMRCNDMRDIGWQDEEYRCAELDAEEGLEWLRVQIDWGGFTDAQLVAGFKRWVAENRPTGIGCSDHRGKARAKGIRNHLAWLGIMRLMHHHPFTSIAQHLPEACRLYSGADWPRSRKKALTQFRELFHFLPEDEVPRHWPTAGGRSD